MRLAAECAVFYVLAGVAILVSWGIVGGVVYALEHWA